MASAILRRLPAEERSHDVVDRLTRHGIAVLSRRRPGELLVEVGTADGTGVVDINLEDAPRLVSTVQQTVAAAGHTPTSILHPVLGVRRDADGRLLAVEPARSAGAREAWLHLRLDAPLSEDEATRLRDRLRGALEAARQVHQDLPEMRERLDAARQDLTAVGNPEADEAASLVAWLLDERLILLGTENGDRRLGLLRDEVPAVVSGPEEAVVQVGRTLVTSPVHRRERMVDVRLQAPGGLVRAIGLFSSQAYADAVTEIPLARRSLERILDLEDLVEGSHDERALRVLFASLPLDIRLGADPEELRDTLVPLLAAQRAQEVTLRCRFDHDAGAAHVVVTLPRGRYSQRIQSRIQEALLDRFAGAQADCHVSMTREEWVLLNVVVHAPRGGTLDKPRLDDLQRQIVALTRTWEDAVRVSLAEQLGTAEGRRLADRWIGTLASHYDERVTPEDAVPDLVMLEQMTADDRPAAMRLAVTGQGRWSARLYLRGAGTELSTLLPVLESLGLVVVDEIPYPISGWGNLHELGLRVPDDLELQPEFASLAAEAALATLAGRAEADELNRLVLRAGLPWRDVALLRAYRRYRLQVGTGFTESYQNAALCEHPRVARALIDLLAALHDPVVSVEEGAVPAARAALAGALDAVRRLDQDRILRGYAGLVDATLRTSRYRDPDAPWLTLKFDSRRVPDIPKPVPHVETFVYAPQFEGLHVRGGPVARGGIRHSDRQEDFRAEVVGLMKAQMTKNALIVPVGAKGGFVIKRPLGDAPGEDVRRGYERFISALLDITDNIVDGEVVHPDGLIALDGPDPYLVVAPDRGTGTFSDLANALAAERGFWLSDAFASGGSHGYDHKRMGITARGAWVAVRRHFTELGVDVDRDPVRVVGIGDMSGDVFGNALQQSPSVRLVAAFDHRDVFLDPDPDPERSFAERARLAGLAGSSWQDYDPQVISEGGGVWSRTAKSIPLSQQARDLLRVDDEELSPPEVIRAILRAPADLLFAGGVGTFVKAGSETHADVADRANDALRIDAADLAVRVVGEGANLALTQRARVQYSRRGGRCNTDAVDNAGGVATSDLEVNLKILLGHAVTEGRIDPAGRDRLLGGAEEEVAERVLADVDGQVRAISHELLTSPGGIEAYEELMADLERRDRLDPEVEALPDAGELARRREAGAGLTRPELGVLLAYAKLDLRDALLGDPLLDDSGLQELWGSYLPSELWARFADLAGEHRLRRELLATRLANECVNDMGITWARRAAEEVGLGPPGVARAYWIAREVTGAAELWRRIAALGSDIDHRVVHEMAETVREVVDGCARVSARQRSAPPSAQAAIDRDAPSAAEMAALPGGIDASARTRLARWLDEGVDADLAERVAGFPRLAAVLDVAEVARRHERPIPEVVAAFDAVAERLPLERLEHTVIGLSPAARWARWQREGLIDDLRRVRRDAVTAALEASGDAEGTDAVARWLVARSEQVQRAERVVAAVQRQETDLDGAAVAVRALRDAVGG